jgi:N4-gp56 family major capsid protein
MTAINDIVPTPIANVDAAIPEIWNAKLYMEAQRSMFWQRFEGEEGSGMPVIRKDDLSKEAGDVIHINTLKLLTGSGVTGESGLQGNEEALQMVQTDVTVDWLRHAVAINKRTKGRINFDFYVQAAQPLLSKWMADKMDRAIFTKFGTATTALYGGDATSTEELASGDKMSTTLLSRIKTYMKHNLAMPIRTMDGNEYYGIVIHEFDEYNLKQDEVWQKAQREAANKGSDNPIFTGAVGIYDGMIIYVNSGIANAANISKNIAFGGEAMFRGYGLMPQFTGQLTDYGFKIGVGIEGVYGESLNNEVNTNFAVVETYAANPNVPAEY